MEERENVLRILEETKEAIKLDNTAKIKELSNQTTNTASLTQDPDNIAIAVMVYSLGKILERQNYKSLRGWEVFYRVIISALDRAINDVRNKNDKEFRKDFELIRKAINKLSGKLKKYVEDVLEGLKLTKHQDFMNMVFLWNRQQIFLGLQCLN